MSKRTININVVLPLPQTYEKYAKETGLSARAQDGVGIDLVRARVENGHEPKAPMGKTRIPMINAAAVVMNCVLAELELHDEVNVIIGEGA